MQLDELLLKTMKHREKHARFSPIMQSPLLRSASLPHSTIRDFGLWFKENPEAQVIDEQAFLLWSKLAHRMSDMEGDWLIGDDLEKSRGEVPSALESSLMDRLTTEIKSLELERLLQDYRDGKPLDLYSELRSQVDRMQTDLDRKRSFEHVDVSIEELIAEDSNNEGLLWRLKSLNRAMRPLRPGDFIIIAARPDAGKTSFVASEITFMARQLPEGRGVLWLNNEGPGRRILARTWQAALQASMPELEQLNNERRLKSMYAEATGGPNQLKIYDVHDLTSHEIEDLIKDEQPGLVIFDMIDNIKFSGSNHHGGERTDQVLESMYQWARNLGVKHDCVVLATSQVSADGEGVRNPRQNMLKDSKTGKQGAADVILMVGKEDDTNARYLTTPKNKLARPQCKDPNAQVFFDRVRSVFYDNASDIQPYSPIIKNPRLDETSLDQDETPY